MGKRTSMAKYYDMQRGTDYSGEIRSRKLLEQSKIEKSKSDRSLASTQDGKSQKNSNLAGASAILNSVSGGSGSPLVEGAKGGLGALVAGANPAVAAAAMGLGVLSSSARNKAKAANDNERARYENESKTLNNVQTALHRLASMRMNV